MKAKKIFFSLVIFILSLTAISVFGQENINILNTDYYLPPGSQLVSPNGEYSLIYQEDGNLVLYDKNKKVIWASNSNNTGKPGRAAMQDDGNFVVYNSEEKPVWASETDKNGPNCIVQLNDNGEFEVIKKGDIDEALYSSKDAGWGWDKPQTGQYGNWEYDQGFNILSLLELNDKSDAELEKMYKKGGTMCDGCIAVELGSRYNADGNFKNGFEWIKKAEYDGNALAWYYMAIMYYKGQGTNKDYNKSLSLYEKLADRYTGVEHISGYRGNLANVQNRIAVFYLNGYGVEKDVNKAKDLLKSAIENGSSAAQVNLNKYF